MRFFSLAFLTLAVMLSFACNGKGNSREYEQVKVADTIVLDDTLSTPSASPHDTFVIAMTGDIMMGTLYPAPALPPHDGKNLFKDTKDILLRADIAAGNLEGTLCDSAQTTKKKSKYNYSFLTPVRFAPRLKEAGFDFLTMANNHSMDFGMTGLLSTENALDQLDIKYAGIKGRNKAAVIEKDGIRYGLCAFGYNGYTLRHQDRLQAKAIIDSIRQCSDILVVTFHGGAEGKTYSHLPQGKEMFLEEDRGELRSFAHFCIDNGADVVFGHGPHVVRCVELYKDRFIAYSLGNFCTPYGISITGISGYAPIIEVGVDSNGVFQRGKIHPFIQQRGLGPRRDTTGVVVRQIRNLTRQDITDNRLHIADDGTITKK